MFEVGWSSIPLQTPLSVTTPTLGQLSKRMALVLRIETSYASWVQEDPRNGDGHHNGGCVDESRGRLLGATTGRYFISKVATVLCRDEGFLLWAGSGSRTNVQLY